ncbi:MAG: hypothetical protein ACC653_04045 [Gammaproteobacteria bacterium]
MIMPMITAEFTPETGSVVNTDEEFFVNVKLHNPLPDVPLWNLFTLENCRIRVTNTTNSRIYPESNGGLPKTVLGNMSLTAETTPNNEWDQEFTLRSGNVAPANASIEYEAIVDIYFNGNEIDVLKSITIPAALSDSPKIVPITQG